MTAYQTPPCEDCGQTTTWHRPTGARRHCAHCRQTILATERLIYNADVDELNVELIAAGYRMISTRAERTEATRILSRFMPDASAVATRLGVSTRTVERYRAALLRTVAADCQQERRDEWRRINGLTP